VSSALDLPRLWRSALRFALLAAASLLLDADPHLPWPAGVLAASLFLAAGSLRAFQARHELGAVRRIADRLIVEKPRSRDASEVVRWRSGELTSRAARDALRHEVDRTLRALDPARLPSASPLRRPAVRPCDDRLEALAGRLADERPVAARGILLAQRLLRDPSGPLYSEGPRLPRELDRVLGALDP
jgi:hypothetical protein